MENLPEINVGVVGHIDHGKTTLLSKLTGKFTDTHSEELKRGITIKLGYAETIIYKDKSGYNNTKAGVPIRYASFIDVPGHEMLMATMLSGAAIIDAAILVIAANEGIKPQTREHLMALQAKNVKNILVVQSKIDLVSKEEAIKSHKDIREFLKNTVAEKAPIVPVSAQQGVNLDKIFEFLALADLPKKDLQAKPIFLVARSFDVNRPGSEIPGLKGGVLGGILKSGVLAVGQEIEIKPGLNVKRPHGKTDYETLTTKIVSLNKGDQKVSSVSSGASISIETALDPWLTKADSLTGCLVSTKGNLPNITHIVKVKSKLFPEVFGLGIRKPVEPLKNKELLMLSINTTITVGIVEKLASDSVEFSLNIPVVALKGDNVGIARNIDGHWRLIGYGEVL